MHQFFKSTFFNFEFVRILSAAPFGGADIAECLVACDQIRDGDPESWHRAWYTQAEKVLLLAEEASQNGDRVSARRSYLRASNYFRASAYMFLDSDRRNPEPRVSRTAASVAAAFRSGMALLDGVTVLHLDIPFESGVMLPAYLYIPAHPKCGNATAGSNDQTRKPNGGKPVLIHVGGADSTQEELYYVYAATGPELGYAVLTFDGPGQGTVLRGRAADAKLHSRPDWENVIGYVIDFLEDLQQQKPETGLDLSRIAVAGASMGGYYALRAAADPRVRACIAIDPFYDMYDFAVMHMGAVFSRVLRAWAFGWVPTTVINGLMGAVMTLDFRTSWEVGIVQWFMGARSPTKALLQMRRYSFRQADGTSFLARVKCPVLVSSAGQSLYLQPGTDAKLIYDALDQVPDENKSVWVATKPEEGGLQAKIGAISLSAQKTFEFLNRNFGMDYEHV
ncbi:MAG: hypothetical protein M1839_009395 [Geoglossum umbratile]|nr:MAG: hypothetical protein M1839_009395 [Geoglossum umbratile]